MVQPHVFNLVRDSILESLIEVKLNVKQRELCQEQEKRIDYDGWSVQPKLVFVKSKGLVEENNQC